MSLFNREPEHHVIVYSNEASNQFDNIRSAAIESGLNVQDFDLGEIEGEQVAGIDIRNLGEHQSMEITRGLHANGINARNMIDYD